MAVFRGDYLSYKKIRGYTCSSQEYARLKPRPIYCLFHVWLYFGIVAVCCTL